MTHTDAPTVLNESSATEAHNPAPTTGNTATTRNTLGDHDEGVAAQDDDSEAHILKSQPDPKFAVQNHCRLRS